MTARSVRSGSRRTLGRLGLRGAAASCAIVALAAVTACSAPGKPETVPSSAGVDAAVTVMVIDNRFEPAEVQIEAGEAVRWVFDAAMEHDVVAADASFVSELMSQGEYVHVFEAPGEFAYDCSIHPEMTGRVIVR